MGQHDRGRPGAVAVSRITTACRALLPADRSGRALAYAASLDSAGTGIFSSSSTVFFVGHHIVGAEQAVLAVTVSGILAFAVQSALGLVIDRIDSHVAYAAIMVLRLFAYAGFALANGFTSYATLLVIGTCADRAASPLFQLIVVGSVSDDTRTQTMAAVRALRNIGLAVGFGLAAAVLATGSDLAMRASFILNGVSFLGLALVALWLRRQQTAQRAASPRHATIPAGSPWRDRRYVVFTLSNTALSLHDSLLFVGIPLWLVERTDLSPSLVPLTLVLNAVITVIAQGVLARMMKGGFPVSRLVIPTVLALVLACVTMAFVGRGIPAMAAVALLIGATILLSVAENTQAVLGWELSVTLASPDARSRYLSLYNLGVTAERTAGPAIVTSLLLSLGLSGWGALAALFITGAAALRLTAGQPAQ